MSGTGAETREARQVLVITDVADSTALAERLGAAANGALWAEHDRVARALLAKHGGWELERTDGLSGLFGSVDDAVGFAMAYQAAARALPHALVVRAAVHAGELTTRENPAEHVARGAKRLEVDGLGIAVAARVLSVCGGGATLLTSDAHAGLGGSARGTSQGHWRLKGVTEPVELFAVGEGGACSDAAKAWRVVQRDGNWVPARDVPHSLPAERDAFVGRSADLKALTDRLDAGARLVSVLGIGGTGKTRLVTRFAWNTLGEFPGGAWFCDLSEARSVDGIAVAVAVGLGVQLGTEDPMVRLGGAIAARGRCLVVLDNFEQVARHAAETVGRWSELAPEARFVVTTREVLGLPGETALALAPLERDEAVALFVTRAAQARRDFALIGDDAAHVSALVKLLDGLPLAIELAASRARMMSPQLLLQRMGERFKLLASTGARHTRQATLRGALDWSWDLLSADERQALAQLSVFEGGFDLPAAEAVLALSDAWPMDAVAALVDKSLVRALGGDRFDLLVSVQEYAAERLDALGGRAEAEARHGAWYATFGDDDAVEALDRVDGPALRRAYLADLDNLVVACRRGLARGDGESATGAFLAAWAILELRGPVLLAGELADALLASHLPPARRGAVLLARADVWFRVGRYVEAEARFLELLQDARSGVAPPWVGRRQASHALMQLGAIARFRSRLDEAVTLSAAAVEEAGRELPGVPRDLMQEGRANNTLAYLFYLLGRVEESRAAFADGLQLLRASGAVRLVGHLLQNRGGVSHRTGRPHDGVVDLEEALTLARAFDNRTSESVVAANLAAVLSVLGRVDEAFRLLEASVVAARIGGSRRQEGNAMINFAAFLLTQGHHDRASELAAEACEIFRGQGDRELMSSSLLLMGNADLERGRFDQGMARLHAALEGVRDPLVPRLESMAVACLADEWALQGRWEEALAGFEEALAGFRRVEDRAMEAEVLPHLAETHLALNQTAAARARVDDALELATKLGVIRVRARALAARARVELREGHAAAARVTLAEAEAQLDAFGGFVNRSTTHAFGLARAEVGSA